MKILVCCGNGLGSSFMLKLNVEKALKKLGIKAEVDHSDLTTAKSSSADIYIATKDIAEALQDGKRTVIALTSIINMNELEEKLIHILAI